MSLPTIAIVGRPNVGKSSFLNAAAHRRISIVEPTPGVTRDRVTVEVEAMGRRFYLVDTGGIGVVDEAQLDQDIELQIETALDLADVIILLVDGRDGLVPLDDRVAEVARRLHKPIVLGVNKIDHPGKGEAVHDFWGLGFGEPHPVSALERIGVERLLDLAAELLPKPDADAVEEGAGLVKIAFVGKRNVGKSTLLNQLAGEERVIVSPIAGTTRDAIDVVVEFDGRRFLAIDTAGIMKKRTINSSIEFYSQVRSELAIRRCDVALFLFDATLEISQVDKKLAMQVVESGRPCVLVVNKWDLATEGVRTGNYLEYLADRLPGLHFAPVVFSSARDGMNLKGIIDVAFDLHEQAQIRVGTGELNRVLEAAFTRKKPGGKDGFKARVFYGTQIDRSPPTFLVFVNDANLFSADYRRYLQNCLREAFAFTEVPVHVLLRQRSSLPRG